MNEGSQSQLRAGWSSFIRAHGVGVIGSEPLCVRGDLRGGPGFAVAGVELQIQKELTLPINYARGNWYAVQGAGPPKSRQSTLLRDDDPSGCWLRVVVSRDYGVPDDLRSRFIASRGRLAQEVDSLLGKRIEAELREIGLRVSGAVAAEVASAQPHLRSTVRVYWWGQTEYAAVANIPVELTVVPNQSFDASRLTELLRSAVPLVVMMPNDDHTYQRAMSQAAHWLLSVADLPVGSNERFMAYFQILEVLIRLAPSRSDESSAASFALLSRLVEEHAPGDTAPLRDFIERLMQRTLAPPLRARFAALAQLLTADAASDIEAFDAMARLRNALVHTRIVSVPATWEEWDVERTMRDLSTRYYRLLVQRAGPGWEVRSEVTSSDT